MKIILTPQDLNSALLAYLENMGINSESMDINLGEFVDITIDVQPKSRVLPSKPDNILVEEIVEALQEQTMSDGNDTPIDSSKDFVGNTPEDVEGDTDDENSLFG